MKNRYTIIYIIDIFFTLVCIALLIYYYSAMSIGFINTGRLAGIFQFDLGQFWLIIFLLILLACSLTALSIYLIIAIRQNKEKRLERSTKLGAVIVPMVFCMLLPVVTGISVAITSSEPLNPEWLCSDSDFEGWINSNPNNSSFQYYFQENRFGRVVDLEHSVSTVDKDNQLIGKHFDCYFRKSDYPEIFSKFAKKLPRFYNESYEKTQDGIRYTVYTGINEYDVIYYYVVIENDSSYFYSEYYSNKAEITSEYSVDRFIADALYNYNSWNAE